MLRAKLSQILQVLWDPQILRLVRAAPPLRSQLQGKTHQLPGQQPELSLKERQSAHRHYQPRQCCVLTSAMLTIRLRQASIVWRRALGS